MSFQVSPTQLAITVVAAGWPLLAGLAVVAWSKTRAATRAARTADLDARLKGLYRTMELREPPERLAMVLETLEEQAAVEASLPARAPRRARQRRAAPQG